MVAERAVEELAAALNISYGSGCGLVAQALELRYRLPRLWALVQDGSLQAWKARKTAEQTMHLGPEAVAFVDAQAAIAGAKNRIVPNLTGLIQEALIRFEPENARAAGGSRPGHRDVIFDYHDDDTLGSATMYATLDSVDAHDLDATVSDVANQLGRLGDHSPAGSPPRPALGLLAHPQRTLDLFGQPSRQRAVEGPSRPPAPPSTSTSPATTSAATPSTARPRPADVEKLGTATLDLLRDWLQRFSGITLKPVLDMTKSPSSTDAVDQHDPPAWMRDLVILRDGHCVFPGCNVDARRCDLDHTDPVCPDGRRWTTRPDQPSQFGVPLQTTPPTQDLHRLALRTRRPRHLRLDQPTRPQLRDPPHSKG